MPQTEKQWKQKFMNLKRRYDSMYQAAMRMEERIKVGSKENALLKAQLANAEKNVFQQKEIVKHHLQQSRATQTELVEEIKDLHRQMRAGGLKVA